MDGRSSTDLTWAMHVALGWMNVVGQGKTSERLHVYSLDLIQKYHDPGGVVLVATIMVLEHHQVSDEKCSKWRVFV